MDYPDCMHYRGVANQLIGKGSYEELRTKSGKDAIEFKHKVEQDLLMDCHNDLVTFITEYRKKRNGVPGPSLKRVNWNPNFVWAKGNPQERRKWLKDYTISWLHDLVNTYAIGRLQDPDNSNGIKDAEKLDWTFESRFSSRTVWGPVEFAHDIVTLAMQKPGSPLAEKIQPHHVFQLQMVVDSMRTAGRWTWDAQSSKMAKLSPHLDPDSPITLMINIMSARLKASPDLASLFAWMESSDLHQLIARTDCYIQSTTLLMNLAEEIKKESLTPAGGGWAHALSHLESKSGNASSCASSVLKMRDSQSNSRLPESMFSGTTYGMWLYSPYLCGAAETDLMVDRYRWGIDTWDFTMFVIEFLHMYNLLLECGHISKPIPLFENIIETFTEDVFYGGRPRLGDRARYGFNFMLSFHKIIDKPSICRLINDKQRRRVKGGYFYDNREKYHQRRGKWWERGRFKDSCRLWALEEANWLKEKVDHKMFPSLEKAGPGTTDFLDAVKTDLIAELHAELPVPFIDFNVVLYTILTILREVDVKIQDLAIEERAELKAQCEAKGQWGLHDKVLALVFATKGNADQDFVDQRLDTPLLRRMGSVVEDMWEKIGPDAMDMVLLNGDGYVGESGTLTPMEKAKLLNGREFVDGFKTLTPVEKAQCNLSLQGKTFSLISREPTIQFSNGESGEKFNSN